MSDIAIQSVSNSRDLKRFINLPWKIYKDDPLWVPPLKSEVKKILTPGRNPFWEHAERELFLALDKNGEPVGRIAAITNKKHNETHGDNAGFFGFFESVPDYGVAEKLFEKAACWLKERNLDRMRGPLNPSINDDIGFLYEGEKRPPVFMMPYNPPYYNEFAGRFGLTKVKDLFAWYIDDTITYPEKVFRIAERVQKRASAVIRPVNMKDFKAEVMKIKQIYNSAWEKNWGAVAMTDAEFDLLAHDFKQIIFPDLALMAEIDGKPVGFSLAVPDMNQIFPKLNGSLFPFGIFHMIGWRKKITCIRVLVMGVMEEYRKRGIETVFYVETYRRAVEHGMKCAEMSWVLENNDVLNKALSTMGAKCYKTYRVYEITL
jgi:GNAT superfamily N-acetyltransferase